MAEPIPPGRAGRLWLRGRVDFARRSLELLDRKQLLLRRELSNLATRLDATRQNWTDSCAEADQWGLRAAALSAADVAFASTSVAGQGRVEVPWRNTMGVWHPGDPRCDTAVLAPVESAAANAAVAPAARAYRRALEAAAAHAATERSWSALSHELRETERRRQAIERRRLPSLEDSLRRLELRLDELEREERVVTRWAKRRHRGAGVGERAAEGC
jgi:V/A-type H+/Na+-transporting ATPase subunit D